MSEQFSVSPPETPSYFNILLYGVPGVGKTVFAATSGNIGDTLFIDAENGMASLRSVRQDMSRIDRIPVNDYAQVARIYEWMRAHCQFRDRNDNDRLSALAGKISGIAPTRRYITVILDSLTEIQKLIAYKLTGIQLGDQNLSDTITPMDFKAWYSNAEGVRLLIRSFRNLPINFIAITGETDVTNAQGVAEKRPALPGKLASEVLGYFDTVGYMASGQKNTPDGIQHIRRLYLQPQPGFYAKNRLAGPDLRHLDNPVIADLISANRSK